MDGMQKSIARPWLVLVSLAFGFSLSLLDATIVNISLASIQAYFRVDLASVSWIVNGYGIVFAVLLIAAGRFADQFGRKRLFLIGMVLFGVSSLCCGLASSLGWLIGFRVLQGIGAAILDAVSLAIISVVFPSEQRGAAIGVWGALSGLAAAVGPVAGGFLVQYLSWHWIFFVNVPVCCIGLFMVARFVPETRDPNASRSIDLPGLVLLTIALVCLLVTIGQGTALGWTSPNTLAISLSALVAFILFGVVERRRTAPLVDFRLFQHRSFSIASLIIFLFGVAIQGAFLLLPLYYVTTQHSTQVQAAYSVIPTPLSGFIASAIFSRLSARVNVRIVGCAGLALVAFGLGLLYTLSPTPTFFDTTWREVLIGAGVGLCYSCFSAIALSDIPRAKTGVGSGLFATSQQIGLALGVSLCISVLTVQSKAQQIQSQLIDVSSFRIAWLVAMSIAACATALMLILGIRQQRKEGERWSETIQCRMPMSLPRVAVLLTMKSNTLYTPQVVTQVIGTLQEMGGEIILIPLVLPDEPSPLNLDVSEPFFRDLFENTIWPLLCRIDALNAGLCVCANVKPVNRMDKAFAGSVSARHQTQESLHITVERTLTALVKRVGIPVLLLEKTHQAALVQRHERMPLDAFGPSGRGRAPDDIAFRSVVTEFLSRCLSVHSVLESTTRREAYHWLISGYSSVEEQLLHLVEKEFGRDHTSELVDLISVAPDSSAFEHFMQRVQEEFGVEMGIGDVLEHPTPSQLSRLLAQRLDSGQ